MKLAISGSSSIGKTTLAKSLAEKLSLQYIPESYEALFENDTPFSGSPEELAPRLEDVLQTKIGLEKEAGDFVVDRCPVDLFQIWLAKKLVLQGPRTGRFFKACASHMSEYDYVILLPWGSIPLNQLEDAKEQFRVMNPWIQCRSHATIVGIANMWVPQKKLISIPPRIKSHDQRVDIIMRIISAK
jgi:hypothetical protein